VAEPGLAPALAYFGGLPSTASLYWENGAGLYAATEFFETTDDAAARRIAAERGLTHIVLPPGGEAGVFFHGVRTGRREAPPAGALASRLAAGELPPWIARDSACDAMGRAVFGEWHVGRALGVWRIAPAVTR
jgi:hypothetical protein